MSTSLAFRLSRNVLTTIQPPIPIAKAWGAAYPATLARPLLDMSQGAPGNPPPDVVLDAVAKTSSSPRSTGYGHALGELKLRAALAREMKTVYGQEADITGNDVAITAGCNMSFVAVVMCLAEAGDESVPLYTRSDQGFLPSIDECKKLITPKTKAITLVTPNNPTGAIYPPALIAQFAQLAQQNDVALVVDETYRDFVEHRPPHHLFSPTRSWRANLVHLFSFSKSYAIPGHRLGAVVASPELLSYVTTTLDCIQVCAPRPPQLALASGSLLFALRSSIESDVEALKARHKLFRASLPPGWTIGSQGGFYAYVKYPFRHVSSVAFCERLAKELGVLVLPARFFYDEAEGRVGLVEEDWDRWLRFSVANIRDEQIVHVCERLKECARYFES